MHEETKRFSLLSAGMLPCRDYVHHKVQALRGEVITPHVIGLLPEPMQTVRVGQAIREAWFRGTVVL